MILRDRVKDYYSQESGHDSSPGSSTEQVPTEHEAGTSADRSGLVQCSGGQFFQTTGSNYTKFHCGTVCGKVHGSLGSS